MKARVAGSNAGEGRQGSPPRGAVRAARSLSVRGRYRRVRVNRKKLMPAKTINEGLQV